MVIYPSQAVAQISPGTEIADVQAAIAVISSQGGGIVNLIAGTYNFTDNLVLPSNIKLAGVGSGTTVIDFGGSALGIIVEGSDPYLTGSVTIASGATTVVGTGTTWTSAMVGQSIMLEDLWYEITAFTDTTHITIGSTYDGSDLTNFRYAIATTVDNVYIDSMTIQNSSTSLIVGSYVNGMNGNDLVLDNGSVGMDYNWISNVNHFTCISQNCVTGYSMNDVTFVTIQPNAIGNSGDGFIANHFRNCVLNNASFQANGGRGLVLQNTNNVGIENFSLQGNTGIQLEFVANNYDIQCTLGSIFGGVSDGIKFTATSDNIVITGNTIHDNGGYGINIANANCNQNVVVANAFYSNTSDDVVDSGTDSIIAANSGTTAHSITDSFTTVDGKTVTVVNGIITDILS